MILLVLIVLSVPFAFVQNRNQCLSGLVKIDGKSSSYLLNHAKILTTDKSAPFIDNVVLIISIPDDQKSELPNILYSPAQYKLKRVEYLRYGRLLIYNIADEVSIGIIITNHSFMDIIHFEDAWCMTTIQYDEGVLKISISKATILHE